MLMMYARRAMYRKWFHCLLDLLMYRATVVKDVKGVYKSNVMHMCGGHGWELVVRGVVYIWTGPGMEG